MSKNDKLQPLQGLVPADATICETTQQMLAKAHRDGVETAFDRAAAMKACPIGEKSACCKHCAMGPCRLNSKDPYAKGEASAAPPSTPSSRATSPAWWPRAPRRTPTTAWRCSACSRVW